MMQAHFVEFVPVDPMRPEAVIDRAEAARAFQANAAPEPSTADSSAPLLDLVI